MDDHRIDVLRYGTPGPISYSPVSQSWSFSRDFSQRYVLSYTGLDRTAVPPQSHILFGLERDQKEERLLLEDYPELIGIVSDFGQDEELSRVIDAATSFFNPRESTLLDFGHALPFERDQSGRLLNVPIAAFATGENGNVLSLRAIGEKTITTNLETQPYLQVPIIGRSDILETPCEEHPIRQIRFAINFEKATNLLAIRLHSSTLICRPLFHKEPLPTKPIKNLAFSTIQSQHRRSRIDPNPIVEIPKSQTGGGTQADVSFNPWSQNRLGIIDDGGNWSIWDLSDVLRGKEHASPKCLQNGSLPRSMNEPTNVGKSVQHDGWCKIEWVGDVNTFIACNRRDAVLYVTKGRAATPFNVELDWISPSEWILDVKVCYSEASRIFILTTLRILCLDISNPLQQSSSTRVPQLLWHHHRDQDDLTLHLTSLSVGEDNYLLLCSRIDACVLAFRIPAADPDDDMRMYLTDPFPIHLPVASTDEGLASIRRKVPLKMIVFREVEQAPPVSRDAARFTPPTRLVKLFVLDHTLSIREHLYSIPHNQEPEPGIGISYNREALSVAKRITQRWKPRLIGTISSDTDEPDLPGPASRGIFPEMRLRSVPKLRSKPVHRLADFTLLYSTLVGRRVPYMRDTPATIRDPQPLKQSLQQLMSLLATTAEKGAMAGQTMLEIMDCLPISSNIDDTIQDLSLFKTQSAEEGRVAGFMLYNLPLEVSREFHSSQPQPIISLKPCEVSGLYDELIRDWLSTLSGDIPAWTRVSKERVIRNLCAELALATMAYVGLEPPSEESSSQQTIQRSSWSQSSQPVQSQDDEQETIQTLGLNVLAPQTRYYSFSTATENLLSQWTIGEDPDSADWKTLASQDATASLPTTPRRTPARSRSRSRTETLRHTRRASPVVPIVQAPGSQPQQDLFRDTFFPSSQITEDSLPMTQIERGIFGGRHARKQSNVKARKKKRAAGF